MNEDIPDCGKSETQQKFVAAKDHLASDLGDEAVVLSMSSGKYYGLNRVSQDVWNSIQTPQSLDGIVEMLLGKYDIDRETCIKEVSEVLDKLNGEGLIETISP